MDGRARERGRSLRWSDLHRHPATALGVVVLSIAAGASLWVYVESAANALATPYSLDYVEGFLVHIAADPALWYHPIDRSPYLVTSYPPVYYALTAALSTVLDPLVAGRLVTILATLGVAVLVAATVRSVGPAAPIGAAMAGLLFLASPLVAFWGVFARVDMLGVSFGVAALYWFHTREGDRAVWGAVVLCLLSLFTKQSLVAAPAAIAATLALNRSPRRAARFCGALVVAGGAGLLAMHVLTGGRSTLHIVVYNQQPPAMARFGFFVVTFVGVHALLLGAAGVALASSGAVPRLYRVYAGTSLAVAAMAIKAGSQFNFFIDTLVAACILVGILLADQLRVPVRFPQERPGVGGRVDRRSVVAAVLLVLTLQFGVFWAGGYLAGLPEDPDAGTYQAAEALEHVEGPVLSEDPRLLAATDHDVTYQPNIMRSLSRGGHWDQSPVTNRIRETKYEVIVLKSPIWSTEWPHRFTHGQKMAIDHHYDLRTHVGTYWIYVPETPGGIPERGPMGTGDDQRSRDG